MKSANVLLIFSLAVANASAAEIISQQRLVRIMPVYQRWSVEGNNQFSEFSIPVQFYFPFSRNLSVSLLGSQASVKGGALETLSGLTDTQLAFNYHLEGAKLLLSLGLSLPNGKRELSLKEFETSDLISLNIFNLQAPNFGQGLSVSPGITWAVPVRDNLVLGVGASYQYKGKFKPLTGLTDGYDPGDEILLTGGLDMRLGATTTITGDFIYTLYGTDKFGDHDVLAAGNKLVANFQLRKYFNYDELWLFARYRSRTKNELAIGGVLVAEQEKTNPDQIEVMGHYRRRFSRRVSARILAEGRFYRDTPTFAGVNLFGAGIAPIVSLSANFQLLAQFKYLTGSFEEGSSLSGLEVGVGTVVKF